MPSRSAARAASLGEPGTLSLCLSAALILLIGPLGCGAGAPADSATPDDALCPLLEPAVADFQYPQDDTLRLNHVQALGTHNSYHLEPPNNVVAEWGYSHAPLDVQIGEQGVRQLELDIHLDEDSGALQVYHVPFVDAETTCLAFTDCLCAVRQWSDRSPAHMPIVIAIEPKDDLDPVSLTGHLDTIDQEIRSVWPEDRLFTPDDLQGEAGSLAEAIAGQGWPTLRALRGQVLFYFLDSGPHRDEYTDGLTTLAGRAMFADPGLGHPLSAFTRVDDPYDTASIQAALAAKVLVRTRGDAGGEGVEAGDTSRLEQALGSGAQFISTDYPAPVDGVDYLAAIPGGQPARCNPVTAPSPCAATDIEDPAWITADP